MSMGESHGIDLYIGQLYTSLGNHTKMSSRITYRRLL